jgi:ribosomal protein S18 acetylase RimI-like enzyme
MEATMVSSADRVRPCTAADIPETVAVLSRAFADKAPFDWIQPDPILRARVMPVMFGAALRWMYPARRGTEVCVAGGRILGAAAWAPPGKWKPSMVKQLLALPGIVGALGFGNLAEYGRRGRAVEAALTVEHPAAPHWYLAALGVDPAAHGKGVGSALVRSGLARCDRDGTPAYLECLEALVPYYRRFGFAVAGRIAMPAGASDQVAMWRPAVTSPKAAAPRS